MMKNQAADHKITKFAHFDCISAATIAAVVHDMKSNPAAAGKIIKGLANANIGLTLALLAQAREADDRAVSAETAYLEGALTVIGALAKNQDALAVRKLLGTVTARSNPAYSN